MGWGGGGGWGAGGGGVGGWGLWGEVGVGRIEGAMCQTSVEGGNSVTFCLGVGSLFGGTWERGIACRFTLWRLGTPEGGYTWE